MIHRILLTFVLAGLTAVAGAETVYKWSDSTGQIHYTDLPPRQADAKLLGVFDQAAGDVDDGTDEGNDDYDDGNQGGEESSQQSGSATTPEPPVSDEAAQSARDDAEKAKVVQCKAAQDRYQKYIESRRLYREQGGKRVYLTDQELTEARARAKQAVDDYCS